MSYTNDVPVTNHQCEIEVKKEEISIPPKKSHADKKNHTGQKHPGNMPQKEQIDHPETINN